jgi:hypothetical protein
MASIPDADLDAIEAQAKQGLNMASALTSPQATLLSGVILRLVAEVRAAREVVEATRALLEELNGGWAEVDAARVALIAYDTQRG